MKLFLSVLLLLPVASILDSPLKAAPQVALSTGKAPLKAPLSEEQKIHHALNRLAFGARPGQVEQIRAVGLNRWMEMQLAPQGIDDALVAAKLSRLQHLNAPPAQLQLAFASDTVGVLKRFREAKEKNRTAPQLNASQQRLLEQIEKSGISPGTSSQALGELNVAKITRAVESNRQLQEVLSDFWSNHFNVDVRKNAVRAYKIVEDRETIRPHVLGKFRDLLSASAKSPAMLIYLDNAQSSREMNGAELPKRRMQKQLNKGRRPRGLNENYARELMELHTLGVDGGYSQKDVQEVARCLTGWTIDREKGTFRFVPFMHDNSEKNVLGQRIPAGGGQRDGEMVLDILARHPATAKYIAQKLCTRFVADTPPPALIEKVAATFRQSDGDLKQVMQTLINAPEFWSPDYYKGKIKSPFEYAVSSVRALGGTINIPDSNKPLGRLQLVVNGASSLRDGGVGNKNRLGRGGAGRTTMPLQLAQMGQPLWAHQSPDGWPEDSSEWVSAGALISRLNFALALTGGEIMDVQASPTALLNGAPGDDARATLNLLLNKILGGEVSASTRATLEKELPAANTPANPAKLCALILGAPEFQRR
ncbi:MAG TPA: DUF1800 domain-containing protein [Abditibacteriaceae bacterium]|jgi:uncharacterized protein (DUF1800 family)